MKRILRFVVVSIALGLAVPAHGQVQTGSILVKAVDQQGGVMPGVTVTISSPVLVSGSMNGITDAGGTYRFPSLVPGTYSVKTELSGFTTIVREGIVVLVGQTTPLDVVIEAVEGPSRAGVPEIGDRGKETKALNRRLDAVFAEAAELVGERLRRVSVEDLAGPGK